MTPGVPRRRARSFSARELAPRWPRWVSARAAWVGVALALAGTDCVPKANYDRALADAASAKAADQAKQNADAARIRSLEHQMADDQATTQDLDAKLSDLTTADHNLQAKLDEATAINQQLRDELARLGKDVDKILVERGTLSKSLEDAKARLEELRKAQAAAQARAELFHELDRRFKPLEDAGQIRVESRGGRLVMEVAGDLLFDASRSELRAAGKGALMEIAHALAMTSQSAAGRRFLVTANVDPPDAREAKARHPKSLWALTAERSVAVVEALVSFGVPPMALTAAAAASFDPLVGNDSPEGRAKNRRVEIALLPSSGEAIAVEAAK